VKNAVPNNQKRCFSIKNVSGQAMDRPPSQGYGGQASWRGAELQEFRIINKEEGNVR
jgi:hypothetical protein